MPAARGTEGAQSIRRAVKLLRILAAGQEHGVRLTDAAAEAGLNRPTAHRILRVLSEEGAVEQDPATRRYLVGQEVSLLGLARPGRFPIRALADPYLREICADCGDTVFLSIRSGNDSICVDRKLGAYPVKVLAIEVGARRPLGTAVSGVVLLSQMPPKEALAIARANEARLALHRLSVPKLMERVRVARAKGYAYSEAGVLKGTRALSVPVFDAEGRAIAAISISAVADRLPGTRVASLVTMIRGQAALITRRIAQVSRPLRG